MSDLDYDAETAVCDPHAHENHLLCGYEEVEAGRPGWDEPDTLGREYEEWLDAFCRSFDPVEPTPCGDLPF